MAHLIVPLCLVGLGANDAFARAGNRRLVNGLIQRLGHANQGQRIVPARLWCVLAFRKRLHAPPGQQVDQVRAEEVVALAKGTVQARV